MQGIVCEPQVDIENPNYKDLCDLLEASSKDDEFAAAWLKKEKASLGMVTGLDDDGKHTLMCLIPRIEENDKETELGYIYIPISLVKSWHPDVEPISSYITGYSNGQLDVDDAKLDVWREKLGFSYHDDLCEYAASFKSVYEYALSFGIANTTEVLFSEADKDILFDGDEPEDKALLESQIFSCALNFRSPEPRDGKLPGFGEYCYFVIKA